MTSLLLRVLAIMLALALLGAGVAVGVVWLRGRIRWHGVGRIR